VYSFGVPGQLRFYKANNIQGAPQVTGSTEEWGRISWYAYDGFSYIPKSHIIGDNYLGNAGVTLTTEGNSRLFGVYANGIQLKLGTHQAGDLYYSIDTVGTLGRIAPGTATYVLTMVGTTPTWQAATGGGGSAQGTGSELQYRNPAGGGAFLALSGSSVSGPALTVGGTFKVTAGATSEVVLSTGTADIAAKTYSNSVSSSFTILRTLAGGVDVGSGDRLGAFRFMGRIGGIDREIANIYADYISTGPRLAFNPTAYTGTGAVIFLGNTVEFQGTFSEYTGGTLKSVSPMNFSISSLQGAVRINEGNATGNLRIYGYSTLPELRLHSSEGSMGAETITSSGRIELGRISFNRCISTNSYDPIATIKGVQPFPNIFGIEIQPNGSSNYIGVYTDGVYINMSGTNAAGDMLYRSSLNGPLTRVDRSSIAVGHVLTLNGSLMPSWQAPTGGGGSAGGGNNGEIQYKNGTGFAAEVALYYDSANDRLGVGAASTAEVTNAASKIYAKSTSTTETLLFLNCNQITAGSSPLIRVDMGTGSFPTVFQFDRNRAVFYGGPDGQYRKYGQIDLVLFASNGASSLTVSNIIPAGATVEGVVGRVTTAFSNIASFRVDDGVTVGLFATGVTNALNNTFTQINSTVWDGPRFFPTTRSLVVTANTTFGFVGQLKITIYYYQFNPHAQ